jgi:hypothetical protein
MVNRRILFILIATTQLTRVILGKERKVKRDRERPREILCAREKRRRKQRRKREGRRKEGGRYRLDKYHLILYSGRNPNTLLPIRKLRIRAIPIHLEQQD